MENTIIQSNFERIVIVRDQSGDRILELKIENHEWRSNPVPNIYAVSDRIIFVADESVRFSQKNNLLISDNTAQFFKYNS